MSSLAFPTTPGSCYKFTVKSADEAAALIRERLGPAARVLSVRSVPVQGMRRLWSAPRLEVIAQIEGETESAGDTAPPVEPVPAATEALRPTPVVARRPSRLANENGAALPALLRRAGLSELALGRLQAAPFWPELAALPLHRALADVGRHLPSLAGPRGSRGPLTRAAFLGAPGCGRTTSLCKWLGVEVFRRGRVGHVVTAEFNRPNAPGVLPVFCEALGVPVVRYPAGTQPGVPGGFVYFDLPGISVRDPAANAEIAQFLERERIEQRVLVLNAAYDHAALRAAYSAGRALGATHLVFTHLDEVPQWGRLWDYLLDGALEPIFLATGPSLTGDCEDDVFGPLISRTLAGGLDATPEAEPLRAASDHP